MTDGQRLDPEPRFNGIASTILVYRNDAVRLWMISIWFISTNKLLETSLMLWMKIAEQYDITPRILLDMNAQFDSDTKQSTDLKVGDVLNADTRLLSKTTPKVVKVRDTSQHEMYR